MLDNKLTERERPPGFHDRPSQLYLALGDQVLVIRGPLAGRRGRVTQRSPAAAWLRFDDGTERLVYTRHLHNPRTQGPAPSAEVH